MANSGQIDFKKPSKFVYWLAGWISIIRHPIRVPRDYARFAQIVMNGSENDSAN
jgi:hypothetical protein